MPQIIKLLQFPHLLIPSFANFLIPFQRNSNVTFNPI